jgi:predicted metal-dependent peptidase
MLVRKGQYSVIDDNLGNNNANVGTSPGGGPKKTMSDIVSGKRIGQEGAKPRNATGKGTAKEIDWDSIVSTMSSDHTARKHMTEQGRRILSELTKKKPLVDWKKHLRRFVDRSLAKEKDVLPKRRFVGSGVYLYGKKKVGKEGFRTAVIACDTSGSISKDQTKTFLTEAMGICESFFIDKLYIIYCSDGIDNVDEVDMSRKQKPDFSKWATTGGNAGGFAPPFKWLEERNITPSFMIYMTDGFATFPSVNRHITKFKDKVMWFILKTIGGDMGDPKFGKVFDIPNQVMKGTE